MSKKLIIPGHGHCKQLELSMDKIKEAQSRTHETKVVTPATYNELEYVFNEAYRDAIKYITEIRHEKTKIEKSMQERKADIILDIIPKMLADQPKSSNNADFRNAVIARDEEYQNHLEHLNKLVALESHFEGIEDHMTRTCRAMKKSMDLIIRAGYIPPVQNTGEKL